LKEDETMKTETLNVSGMSCGGCTAKVTGALSALSGIAKVDVSLPKNTAQVTFDEGAVSVKQMGAALHAAGFGLSSETGPAPTAHKGCCS
jgi:copper chaperone